MHPMDSEAAAGNAARGRGTAGAALKAAREAAGLSVDTVAQQLKLAPRQVKALEEDDFERLPGRTFVRGFARNYARFMQLDPDTVLGLMPAAGSAPALERPPLAASRRPMGEIPMARVARRPASQWLLALLLAIIVAGVGYFEYTHEYARRAMGLGSDAGSVPDASDAGATTANASSPAMGGAASATMSTALPNPVSESPAGASSDPKPGSGLPGTIAPGAPGAAAEGATAPVTPAAAPGAALAPAGPATSVPATAAVVNAPLVLTFKGTSWAEVKDGHGRVILQMTGGAGMTQTVSGTPPLELALGNAREVAVSFRGQSLDLAPYMRGGVARVALK